MTVQNIAEVHFKWSNWICLQMSSNVFVTRHPCVFWEGPGDLICLTCLGVCKSGGSRSNVFIKTFPAKFSDRPILQRMSDKLDLRGSGKFYHPTQLSLGKGGFLLNQQCLAIMKSKASFKCITQQRMSTTQQSTWWWMRLVIRGRQWSRVQIQGLHSCERSKRRTSSSIQRQLQRIQLKKNTKNEEWAEKKNDYYLQSFK